jgi:DMSO reductase anchor subunit
VVPYALLLWTDRLPGAVPWLGAAVATSGVVGVGCSVFIYSTTRRSSWRTSSVTATFLLSAAVSGLATVVWASSISRMLSSDRTLPDGRGCALVLVALALVKLLGEASALRFLRRPLDDERGRRARLLARELRPVTARRFVAGVVGGVLLPIAYVASVVVAPVWVGALLATVALAAVVVGELAERSLFFTAASAPR